MKGKGLWATQKLRRSKAASSINMPFQVINSCKGKCSSKRLLGQCCCTWVHNDLNVLRPCCGTMPSMLPSHADFAGLPTTK